MGKQPWFVICQWLMAVTSFTFSNVLWLYIKYPVSHHFHKWHCVKLIFLLFFISWKHKQSHLPLENRIYSTICDHSHGWSSFNLTVDYHHNLMAEYIDFCQCLVQYFLAQFFFIVLEEQLHYCPLLKPWLLQLQTSMDWHLYARLGTGENLLSINVSSLSQIIKLLIFGIIIYNQ